MKSPKLNEAKPKNDIIFSNIFTSKGRIFSTYSNDLSVCFHALGHLTETTELWMFSGKRL